MLTFIINITSSRNMLSQNQWQADSPLWLLACTESLPEMVELLKVIEEV